MNENTITILATDGENCTVNEAELTALVNERNEAVEDIGVTVANITRLLKDLGVMQPDGKIAFSMKVLSRTIQRMLFSSDTMTEKFSYLADLDPMLKKYATSNP